MRSKVGVIYRIKLMRKNGTCRTEFARKSIPSTSLSSHVTLSKLMKNPRTHSETLIVIICRSRRELALLLAEAYRQPTGTATRILMAIPAQTAIAACL